MKSFKQLNESLKDTCWKGYEAIGTKKKNGKEVPNCVPVKEEESEAEKAKKELDLKLSKWKNQQRAAKALGEEVLDEGKMGQLHADIEDHLGKHVANYKKTGGSEHFAGKVEATTKHIAKLHNISHEAAQKHVNDYVDNNLKEEKKEDLPFTPDKPHKPIAKAGKFGLGYSVAKHLAKQGMKKVTKEEVEQIDELDKKTLGSYVAKSHDQLMKHTSTVNFKQGRGDSDAFAYAHDKEAVRKTANRTKGLHQAINKLAKEEALDEVSKDTLTSYVHKSFAAGNELHKQIEKETDPAKKAELKAKLSKRNTGIIKAAKKIREENMQEKYVSDAQRKAVWASKNEKNEELHPNQKKLDMNKNGKLDADDFKKLRKEETLDEVMTPMQKLRDAHDRHMEKALAANKAGDDEATKVHQKYMQKIRAKMDKLKQNEEIDLTELENLCEISKATLGSYVKKAAKDRGFAGMEVGALHAKSSLERMKKRLTGIEKATDKLAKEEFEQLSEADVAAIRAQYKKNESDNRHTENAELLAKHFGSKSDQNKVAKAKAYRDRNNGYSSDAEGRHYSKLAHEVHSKLYHHIAEEVELSESAEDKAASEVHKNLLYGSVKHGAQDIPGHIKAVMKKHGATDYNKVVTAVRKKGYTGKINETVEEAVNVDVTSPAQKMAKTGKMSIKDKLLSIPRGFKAARAGKSEVDANLNKEETEMLTFKQLMQNISEAKIDDLKDRIAARKATQSAYDKDYKPEPKSNVVKVKGHSYGAGEEEGEDEDDNNKKVSKPAKPEVKRGRGRPAGSKSGARN